MEPASFSLVNRSCLFIGVQRLFVAALHHANDSKLAFCDGDLSIVTDFLSAADTLFINSSRFIGPAQVAKAVASINQADGHPVLRASTRLFPFAGLKSLLGFVQLRQSGSGAWA
jgi:hypothetical protein